MNNRCNGQVLLLSPAIALAGLIGSPCLALAETDEIPRSGSPSVVIPEVISAPAIVEDELEASDDRPLVPKPIPLAEFSTEARDLAGAVPAIPAVVETHPADDLAQTIAPPSATQPGLAARSRLTGDWGGVRSQWEAAGITLDLEFTQYLQRLAAGTGSEAVDYGGRLDGYLELDTEKLGWWDGGRLNAHVEYNFGNLPDSLGGTFFPTNSGMGFPSGSPNFLAATSLYLSQRLGSRGSLLIGKINALDLLDNDPFFGGLGTRRFQNAVFAAPPSGLVPPVFFGAIANLRVDPVSFSLWVYDPEDRTQDYWPSGLFASGVTFSLTTAYNTQIAQRPTTFSITGIYTTKTGIDFNSLSNSFQQNSLRQGIDPSTKQGSYSVAFQFTHLLHQLESNPRQGWGIFVKGATSDGNPNYVQNSIIVGIGGYGLFAGRELDSFGVGYYYYDLSNDLQDTLNVNRERIGDEQGLEVYYSYAVTPWFFLTGDVQYISPPRNALEDAFILGLRANIRF